MNDSILRRAATETRRRFALAVSISAGLSMMVLAPACLAFGFEEVAEKARALAEREYQAPEMNISQALGDLEYEEYAQIQYDPERALWRDEGLPFDLSFFHEGMHYTSAVDINVINEDGVSKIPFDADNFHYGDVALSEEDLEGLGFAGFKIHHPINDPNIRDEIMVFQGASYFRVVGRNQIYGLSGRGLAIDTALPSGEEFPNFREFWVVKPQADSQTLTIFALLDSPSATGAFRYVLDPGDDSVLDVQSRLFLRNPVKKLGIAPLTSMFLFGPSQPSQALNYRPAIHDSNGLLIHDDNSGWTWRPLTNPDQVDAEHYVTLDQVDVTHQRAESLRGFGLLQRSHDFHDYEDLIDRYHLRPSGWVETQGDWGPGEVELIEIPTADETNDNIVALWKPDEVPQPGEPIDFNYRIHWTMNESALHDENLAWVDRTMRSRGEVRQNNLIRQPDGSLAFIIDFKGPVFETLPEDGPPLMAQVNVGENGELIESRLVPNDAEGGWRSIVRVKRHDDSQPLEIRNYLRVGEQRVSETWFYRLPAED